MHAVIAACTLAAIGCGTEYTPPPTFSAIYPALFPLPTLSQCNFCHSLPANDKSNGQLSMGADRSTAYAALMQVSTSSHCGGIQLVVPYDPDASLLVQKFSPNPPCGDRMPLGGQELSPDKLALVRGWIAEGAAND